jgi:hypothetical protein
MPGFLVLLLLLLLLLLQEPQLLLRRPGAVSAVLGVLRSTFKLGSDELLQVIARSLFVNADAKHVCM